MQRIPSWRAAVAAASLAALAACGGGVGEVVVVLGFLGSAGGDWLQDDKPAEGAGEVGLQLRSTCGGGTDDCTINILPAGGTQNLYAADFDLTFSSNLPGCVASGTGRASGTRLTLTGCFNGQYVNINQAVSDDGEKRMFFDFTPDLVPGVWVEIQKGQRRFAFKNNSEGCELTSPATGVNISLNDSDVTNPAGPFETTIESFVISGGGAAWQGRFVGVSGMRLTRGNEVLELQRRQSSDTCPV